MGAKVSTFASSLVWLPFEPYISRTNPRSFGQPCRVPNPSHWGGHLSKLGNSNASWWHRSNEHTFQSGIPDAIKIYNTDKLYKSEIRVWRFPSINLAGCFTIYSWKAESEDSHPNTKYQSQPLLTSIYYPNIKCLLHMNLRSLPARQSRGSRSSVDVSVIMDYLSQHYFPSYFEWNVLMKNKSLRITLRNVHCFSIHYETN